MCWSGREREIGPAPRPDAPSSHTLARPHTGLIADPTDKVADAPIIVHTNGKAEHTFGNLPQAYKFTLSVSAQAPSGRWSEPQSAKIETAMGCAPPAPPSFGGKGMETNLYSKLGAGGEGGGMGALSATRSQNVGLMTGGEYSYPGLPSYRDEASGIGAAAIVGGSIVVAAILVVILLMVNPPMVLGTPRAPAVFPRESSPLTPSRAARSSLARAHLSHPPLRRSPRPLRLLALLPVPRVWRAA